MIEATSESDDGRDGPAFTLTLSRILLSAGGVLLLPRQFVSAGIAFTLGLALRAVHRRRHPAASEDEAGAEATPAERSSSDDAVSTE